MMFKSYLSLAGDSRCGPVARGTESGCHLVCGGGMGGRKLQLERSEFNNNTDAISSTNFESANVSM